MMTWFWGLIYFYYSAAFHVMKYCLMHMCMYLMVFFRENDPIHLLTRRWNALSLSRIHWSKFSSGSFIAFAVHLKLSYMYLHKMVVQVQSSASNQTVLKPVLNWANVCSPNILQILRRTVIRFLIELLVRRIWFGQSKLYFILNWLVMRCKLRPELAADAQQTAWSKM